MASEEDIRSELGLVQIYTGNGKGKTTASLGLAMRASGRGLKVLIIQFLKPSDGYGEQVACGKLGIEIRSMGADHFVFGKPKPEDIAMAHDALAEAERLMCTGDYDLVILDEAMNAVRLNLITSQELIASLDRRPKNVEIVLTGRGMTPELEEYADLITEMALVKHPMDKGIGARKGIEYRSHDEAGTRGNKMSDILYRYGSRYYINLTNRCPCKCTFCVRNRTDALGDAECLWLDREPTPEEVMAELRAADLSGTDEVVFCGYGEPTERLDAIIEIADMIHSELRKRVRLDTNGLGSLINRRDIVPELEGHIDSVSISLNAPNESEYLALTRSAFGPGSYRAVLDFISECRERINGVTVSVVGSSLGEASIEECARIADRMNVAFRVRRCGLSVFAGEPLLY